MRLRRAWAACVVVAFVVGISAPARALAPTDVTVTPGAVSSVVSVSPDVYYDVVSAKYYLFTTGMGIGVYTATDGASWTAATGASTPTGPYSDPSVVALPDGTYRMYYAYRAMPGPGAPCSGKELRYATSTDLIRWTPVSTTLLSDLGCGVPNVVRLSDGTWRLYYVRGGPGLEHGTYMATSADGLTWNPTNTLLTPRDFVDPSVVQLPNGSWLMFTADFMSPPTPGFVQRLYVGTSEDGLAWDFGAAAPLYAAPTGQGAFDPDAVVMPDGSVRLWWSQGRDAMVATVATGSVTVDDAPDPVPVAPAKPVVSVSASGAKVSWTYPAGAPAPDGYTVQVKSGAMWKDVGTTRAASLRLNWSQTGAKKGASFSVRVVAFIDAATATSPATRAQRPR